MKHVIILGAGISGLTLGWYLKKWGSDTLKLTILEKQSRPGGWIRSEKRDGFLFETGPRSCRTTGMGIHTLNLIEELGLTPSVIFPDPAANKRYILLNQSLKMIPTRPLSLLTSSFLGQFLTGCWKDWRTPPGSEHDESVDAFFTRRMGKPIAENFIDPLISGIFAGDSSALSILSCFPELKKDEQTYGGIVKGILRKKRVKISDESPFIQAARSFPIYSFQEGMEALPQTLYSHLQSSVYFNKAVKKIDQYNGTIEVELEAGEKIKGDYLFSTLAASHLAPLIENNEIGHLLAQISYASPVVLNLGYRRSVLNQKGYGYLIPSYQMEKILGIVWDSCTFPQHFFEGYTALTVMMGGARHPDFIHKPEEEILTIALQALQNHLGIKTDPDLYLLNKSYVAIPQYTVGYSTLIQAIQKKIHDEFPQINLLGTSFNGVSVNECVMRSMEAASTFVNCKKRTLVLH